MRKITLLAVSLLTFASVLFPQENEPLCDIDGDGLEDSVVLDTTRFVIVCRLSSHNYEPMESLPLETYGDHDFISCCEGGFDYDTNWMRAGASRSFMYDAEKRKIRLVSISRYELGNAVNDGSGDSGINLLTGKYRGEWNHFDYEKEELVSLPGIETNMYFPAVYLEDFDDSVYFEYAERCAALYSKEVETYEQNNK